MQKNRIETLHHNGNPFGIKTKMLEHPRLSPPIACPTRSRTVDWAVGLNRNRVEFTLWWQSSILDHLVIIIIIIITGTNNLWTSKLLLTWLTLQSDADRLRMRLNSDSTLYACQPSSRISNLGGWKNGYDSVTSSEMPKYSLVNSLINLLPWI